jgi:hypothetical protein
MPTFAQLIAHPALACAVLTASNLFGAVYFIFRG